MSDVAEQIRAAFPNTRIERVDNADTRNYRVSFDKIGGRIGFKCAVSLADGIQELKTAFETGLITDYQDILYHNQRFLARCGARGARGDLQTNVMAAFSAGAAR